jgi:hypothetical protein
LNTAAFIVDEVAKRSSWTKFGWLRGKDIAEEHSYLHTEARNSGLCPVAIPAKVIWEYTEKRNSTHLFSALPLIYSDGHVRLSTIYFRDIYIRLARGRSRR